MISLRDVSFTYPGGTGEGILAGINLDIDTGEWVALTGGNGSGKSTLCRLIAGLAKPSGGSVTVDGSMLYHGTAACGDGISVGITFQNPDSQFCTATVRREILFGMENIGLDETVLAARLEELGAVFALAGLLERNPHTLSGGEKQRVALSSVWAMYPRHLVLDEPCSFLDPPSRRSFQANVRSTVHDGGVTVVWATLDPCELALAGRVICLEGGRIVYDGPPDTPPGSLPEHVLAHDGFSVIGGYGGVKQPLGVGEAMPASVVDIEDAEFRPGNGDFRLHIDNLSLTGGEAVGVLCPSGSGKTTLLLACSGLLPPLRGSATILGKAIRSRNDFPAGRVALLFQIPEDGFFASTVFEEVALGYRSFHGRRGEREAISQALAMVGLEPERFLGRSPFHLSQGQKRLVSIASMLVLPAEMYLFDEPTLFLDGRSLQCVVDAIRRLRERGVSIVIASHEPAFLRCITDRVITLDRGRIVGE
ncbi:MAG: ATP-binding cassette domain-containing protein [bacterium]|nr:MAG: ATP-binding cassette domain-containing protein [bacterium]